MIFSAYLKKDKHNHTHKKSAGWKKGLGGGTVTLHRKVQKKIEKEEETI